MRAHSPKFVVTLVQCSAISLALAGLFRNELKAQDIDSLLKSARDFQVEKDFNSAEILLTQAIRLTRSESVELKAGCFFTLGYLYQDWSETVEADRKKDLLLLAIAAYDSALKFEPLNASILNNIANSFWSLGDRKRAVEFAKRSSEIKHEFQPLFLFNYGTKLDSLRRTDLAIEAYRHAALLDSSFESPRRALLEIYLDSTKNNNLESILSWCNELAKKGYAVLSGEGLRRLLSRKLPGDLSESALLLLVDQYAHTGYPPGYFRSVEKQQFEAIKQINAQLNTGVDEVIQAYEEKAGAILWWREPQRFHVFSRLLKTIGDFYYSTEDWERAKEYYNQAVYGVQPERQLALNLGAAVYLASVYIHNKNEGALDKISKVVQLAKGYESRQRIDWVSFRNFNNLLGSYYFDRGMWESAISHLENASYASTKLSIEESPIVMELLAKSYDYTDQPEKAWSMYIFASQAYRNVGDKEKEEEMRRGIDEFNRRDHRKVRLSTMVMGRILNGRDRKDNLPPLSDLPGPPLPPTTGAAKR